MENKLCTTITEMCILPLTVICNVKGAFLQILVKLAVNSSFRFTNVRQVKSDLSQLTDIHTFSLAELPLVRFEIN